jgi:hypothetical protein
VQFFSLKRYKHYWVQVIFRIKGILEKKSHIFTELNSRINGYFKGITIISDQITKSHSGCTDFTYMHLHNNVINVIHLQIF